MGLKIDNSPIDTRLSKMEVAIENIASFAATGSLAINQLMEREAATTVTTKVVSMEEPKWTTVMAKNVCYVVSRVVETLADAPKQEECKFNLRFTSFKAKEGEIEKEFMQRLNTKLLQSQMRLHTKVIVATRQQPAIVQASTLIVGAHPDTMLLKFTTNEDHQVTLQGCKGLAGTKLGLDEDLTPTQQTCKSELWPLFKEAKVTSKHAFWHAAELFVDDIQICLPSSI
jgi:hypothetical protein